jgi:hypothetical protein
MPGGLRPVLTMSDVFGPGHTFVPRVHDATSDWLPPGACVLDSLTGNQLAIAGDMPVVCSEGFTTPVGLDLLALAGLELARNRIPFRAGGALKATAEAAKLGGMLVLQHAFPSDAWQSARSWIDMTLLSYLNNKANLPALSPARHTPAREVVDRAEFFSAREHRLPIVLKAATDQSSGGGSGVVICRNPADFDRARALFKQCDQIVVEAMLDIVGNPCLNFAVIAPDDVRYLGSAEQVVSPEGKHQGNWIDLEAPLPPAVVEPAMEVVQRGAAMGYRGFVGVDMAVTRDEHAYVLDLNFRLNASTAALVLAPAIQDRFGASVSHVHKFQHAGSAEEFARSLEPWVRSGELVPLTFFDAEAAGHSGQPTIVQAMIVNSSRAAVLKTESRLADAGIA